METKPEIKNRIGFKFTVVLIPFKRLARFYKNLSIKGKLLALFYLQIVIPLIIIGYMSYRSSESIIVKKSQAYLEYAADVVELRLNDYVRNINIIMKGMVSNTVLYDVTDSSMFVKSAVDVQASNDEIKNLFRKTVDARPEVQAVCLVPNNVGDSKEAGDSSMDENSSIKNILQIGSEAGDNQNGNNDSIYKKILKKARENPNNVVWYMTVKNQKIENIFVAQTVNSMVTYEEAGLLVVQLRIKFLDNVFLDLKNDLMKDVIIVTGDNKYITSKNNANSENGENKELVKSSSLLKPELFNKFVKNKDLVIEDKMLISYVSVDGPDWKAVSYTPLKDVYQDVYRLRERIVILCLITLLILSTLSILIALDFIKPINRLVREMEKVRKGKSDVYIENDREDELGFLNETFNSMIKEINYLVTGIYREQITRKEAEIKALQSQINPHFLFNTLESINWMAQLNNVPEISDTVSDLSSLMEASIGRGDKLITVKEEFTYSDKYISLLKRRFEDKIGLVKNVQDEALKVKIPRLLIQPLIENAVYHGIEQSREKGTINLNAYIDDHDNLLIIEVLDNGLGIELDELEALNKKLSMDNDTYFKTLNSKKNKSIGIENVNRRIKLFYGETYGLQIESEVNKYTKVIVRIPLKQDNKEEGYYVQGIDN